MSEEETKTTTDSHTYTFVVAAGISLHVEVTAQSIEEAIEKAKDAAVQSLCHQCARGEPGEWSTSGELDCDPTSAPLMDIHCDGEPLRTEDVKHVVEAWA